MVRDKILDYILHTPENTNPAILNTLLDELVDEEGAYEIMVDDNSLVLLCKKEASAGVTPII